MELPDNLALVAPTNQLLNRVAEAVEQETIATSYIQSVIDHMLALAAATGTSKKDTRQMVGLAAVQLGLPLRIITIDLTADGSLRPQHLQVVINPVISERSESTEFGREGCWSCGRIHGTVERASAVTLNGLDREGKSLNLQLAGFVARIAQHEVDHLDGIRFPDRIPETAPEHLHWVEIEEFPSYRTQWSTWTKLCPRETWLNLKNGVVSEK